MLLPFNRGAFNRKSGSFLATLTGTGTIEANPRVTIVMEATLTGTGTIEANSQGLFTSTLSGTGTIEAEAIKFKNTSSTLTGEGKVNAACFITSYKYLNYNGPLEPGDVLVIDTARKTIKKDGSNFLFFFSGEFFNLKPGGNIFTFSDSEASRTLSLNSTYEDRYL